MTRYVNYAKRNAQYAERRLCQLRTICPDLSDDVLATTDLRSLSVAVRRARGGKQTVLKRARDPAPPVDNAAPREQLSHTAASEHSVTQVC